MCKGVRRLSEATFTVIWCPQQTQIIHPDWNVGGSVWCGTLKREIFCPDARYFVNESAMWPFAGQDIPHTGWPSHQRCPGRNWSALPSPVLGHFRFLQATLKSLAAVGRVWLGYITATWSNKNRRKRDDDFFQKLSLYKRIFRYYVFMQSQSHKL